MEQVDLISLKKNLPKGWSRIIGEKLGISRSSVSTALKGKNLLHPAVELAIQMRDQHQEQKEAIKSKIASR